MVVVEAIGAVVFTTFPGLTSVFLATKSSNIGEALLEESWPRDGVVITSLVLVIN